MKEGFGRRLPAEEIKRDLQEQIDEAKIAALGEKKQRIVTEVHATDRAGKVLTGRESKDYALESGIPEEELFPKDSRILNVGDPWQRLDREGVVSIDYESGPEAMFVQDPKKWLAELPQEIDTFLIQFDEASRTNEVLSREAGSIHDSLNAIRTVNVEEYPTYVAFFEHFLKRMNELGTHERSNAEAWKIRELWYVAHRFMRGLDDVHLWKTVIEPELRREAVRQKGLSSDERERIRRSLITKHRFLKRTQFAEFRKATFPDVPFEDAAFDRVVASWSLSTHLFPVLDLAGLGVYWDEISRLLKRDGVAYLWPVYGGNEQALARSLWEYREREGDAAVFTEDSDGRRKWVWADEPGFEYALTNGTLVIFPKRASMRAKQRVMEKALSNA